MRCRWEGAEEEYFGPREELPPQILPVQIKMSTTMMTRKKKPPIPPPRPRPKGLEDCAWFAALRAVVLVETGVDGQFTFWRERALTNAVCWLSAIEADRGGEGVVAIIGGHRGVQSSLGWIYEIHVTC